MEEIRCVADFLNCLKQFKVDNKQSELFFRGHRDKNYLLLPLVYRGNRIEYEDRFYKEAIMMRPDEFEAERTTIEKLVKMQHYGFPTRLLDISTNPLVALYFACDLYDETKKNSEAGKDGEVIVFDIPKKGIKFYDSDKVAILANLAKCKNDFCVPDTKNDITFNKDKQARHLVHDIRADISYFDNVIAPADVASVTVVRAKQANLRIIRQHGAFLLFGIKIKKAVPADIPKEWIRGRIRIHNGYKDTIIEQLKPLGFSKSALCPELEHLAKEMLKTYN